MSTDPGDLVLDPTCGADTTATVAEQWGRRWITIDTSRVALALARTRIMGARYPYYVLADSREGQVKEAEVSRTTPSSEATHARIRQGFVYERVPHITLKSIANNAEIDVIWEKWQANLEPLREKLNATLKNQREEWEIPARGRCDVAGHRQGRPCRLVAGAHRAAEGDRRVHRDQGRVRVPLR
jgi:adenine-specific DNA-methyltransferase